MKKKIAVVLAAAMVIGSLAGCGAKETAAPAAEEKTEEAVESTESEAAALVGDTNGDGVVKVGFSAFTMADAWMVGVDEEMKALCEENGFEYTSQGAESNSATQVNQIENMVTMGCDWMFVTVFEKEVLKDACVNAMANGCNIITPGALFDAETERDAFYGQLNSSQYDYGHSAALAANDWVEATFPDAAEGSIECAVFVNTSAEAFQDRANAMKEIETINPKVKIVEVYDLVGQDAPAAKCQEYTDQLFMQHPDCKLILSHSSDFATAINENVMKTAGLDPATIAIFSDDWLTAAGNLIKESADNTSVLRGLVASGDIIKTIINVVKGDVAADENGLIPTDIFTYTVENIDEGLAEFGE